MSATPLVLSTPTNLLAEQRVTDTASLFVRNVQDWAEGMTMAPLPLDGWEIALSGLIDPRRHVIRGEELRAMPQVEQEMILQCAGNGRTAYTGAKGTPWGQGGIANVRFAGVPLKAILDAHDISIDSRVRYITAEGRDASAGLDKPNFEHSIPIADVLDRGFLALSLNGEPLPAVHGGPVRLVTPGLFGTMQVKWLARLRFEEAESTSYYHATEYRVPHARLAPGEPFAFTPDNSRPTWDIRLASMILDPEPGARLHAGSCPVSGVAYNDGKAIIETVQVSIDRGHLWQAATIDAPASPYAWYQWTTSVTLNPGSQEIWVRATDTLGRTQPLDGNIDWNPNGYEWAGVHKIEVDVG